jgi:hypothetical protein
VTGDEERELRGLLMQADLDLKRKQGFWETPRNLAILLGSVTAITAALAGLAGYKIGSQPPAPPPQIIFQPGSIQVLPAAPAK